MAVQRLQRILASAGVDSRRKCEELIKSGVVQVNKNIVDKLPAFADPEKDVITVSGKKIHAEQKVYFLLNKPKGVICTNYDPAGRKKAIDLVRTDKRVFCVGRLDIDTTGLIILTNDSELANKLAHPKYGLPKTYVAKIKGRVTGEQVEKIKKGIWLSEGKTSRAAIKILKRSHKESIVEITIRQGLNHQVRRMLARVGFSVKSLTRTQIGRINSRGLGIGKFRQLTGTEVAFLKKTSTS
jgi:23S rRNA pseudouridine2605 synthase